jgi:preprotein translocase subunit SecG
MVSVLAVLHIIVCVFLILLIMIQDPKGGSSGLFSGGSNSIIGSSGSADFLTTLTRYTAIVFGVLCVVLTIVTKPATTGVFSKAPVSLEQNVENAAAEAAAEVTGKNTAPASPATVNPAPAESSAPAPDQSKNPAK